MNFHIITIFPEIFNSYFNESIIKRALDNNKININIHDLRKWTKDKHKTVDDTPYGGGAGMLMKVEPLYRAITEIKNQIKNSNGQNTKTILTSAKGKTWTQEKANNLKNLDNLIIICGRYEGVDERILNYVDEEISIGNYVLTGGEIPAMAIIDSITRLSPGVLGNEKSLEDESFKIQNSKFKIQKEYPQFTRPEVFTDNEGNKHKVPDILLSGNHAEIEKWKKENKKS